MASNINTTTIDATYPIAGQDNDTQGFRNNWTSIVSNFTTASLEISNIQSNLATLQGYLTPTGNVYAGNLYVGNIIATTSNLSLTSGSFTAANVNANAATISGNISTGNLTVNGITTQVGNLYVQGNLVVSGTTTSVVKEVISSTEVIAGQLTANSGTASTSTTTGALLVKGGAGLTGNIYTAGNIFTSGNLSVNNAIVTTLGSGANLIIDPDGTADVYFTPNTELFVQSGASSTSVSSGAIVVTGGVGISGNAYIGNNINVANTAIIGLPLTITALNANLQYGTSANNYSQINTQNQSWGTNASTDFVATPNNASSDSDTYIDMGINGSGYVANAAAGYGASYANDGYLYVQGNATTKGGNLMLAAMNSTNNIFLAVGGQNAANIIATVSNTGVTANGTLTATGNVSINNNLSVTGNVTFAGNVTAGTTWPVSIGGSGGSVVTNGAGSLYLQGTSSMFIQPTNGLTVQAGTVTMSSTSFIGTINNMTIGATTPQSGTFTTVTLTSAIQFANLTTTQITAISSPKPGMTVFNYTTGNVQVYNGTKWANVQLS
jgi:hypothetical protein